MSWRKCDQRTALRQERQADVDCPLDLNSLAGKKGIACDHEATCDSVGMTAS